MINRLDRHIESRMALRKTQLIKKILDAKKTNKRGDLTGMHNATSLETKQKKHARHEERMTSRLIKDMRDGELGKQSWQMGYHPT